MEREEDQESDAEGRYSGNEQSYGEELYEEVSDIDEESIAEEQSHEEEQYEEESTREAESDTEENDVFGQEQYDVDEPEMGTNSWIEPQ